MPIVLAHSPAGVDGQNYTISASSQLAGLIEISDGDFRWDCADVLNVSRRDIAAVSTVTYEWQDRSRVTSAYLHADVGLHVIQEGIVRGLSVGTQPVGGVAGRKRG